MRTIQAASLASVMLLAGCGRSSDGGAAEPPAPAFPWPDGDLQKVDLKYGATEGTPSGLRWRQLSPGTGDARPAPHDTVKVHYRGMLLDGTVFDESFKRGEPIRFQIGAGRVIKGWDEAIPAMTLGEKRLLVVPFWLAYGEAGAGGVIPPRATLVFEVELLSWEPAAKP